MSAASHQSILVVCTGNICRSPMAEGLLRARLAAHPSIDVASAGIAALVGHPADPFAVEVARDRGIDLSAHRGRQLNQQALIEHHLVLVMERFHTQWIVSRWPMARGRVFLFGHWQGGENVPDPYGRSRPAFEAVMDRLEIYVAEWLKKLIGGSKSP